MKKTIIFTAVVLALVGAASIAGYAFAQNGTPPTQPNPGTGYGYGMMGGRGQMMGNGGGMMGGGGRHGQGGMMGGVYSNTMPMMAGNGAMHEAMYDALAKALDLSRADLDARVANGETPYDIALAQGLTAEQWQALMIETRTTVLAQLVTDGTLTQAQADAMLARMAQMQANGNCPHLNP